VQAGQLHALMICGKRDSFAHLSLQKLTEKVRSKE